jgi:hypothetical protein
MSPRSLLISLNRLRNARKSITLAKKREESAIRHAEEEKAKDRRRWERDRKARAKNENAHRVGLCGINFYFQNSGWRTCHACGNPLVFYDSAAEAEIHNKPCPGRR